MRYQLQWAVNLLIRYGREVTVCDKKYAKEQISYTGICSFFLSNSNTARGQKCYT